MKWTRPLTRPIRSETSNCKLLLAEHRIMFSGFLQERTISCSVRRSLRLDVALLIGLVRCLVQCCDSISTYFLTSKWSILCANIPAGLFLATNFILYTPFLLNSGHHGHIKVHTVAVAVKVVNGQWPSPQIWYEQNEWVSKNFWSSCFKQFIFGQISAIKTRCAV